MSLIASAAEVFRLASYRGDTEFMQDLGLDQESIGEVTDLLKSCGAADSLEELCVAVSCDPSTAE